MTLTVTAPPDFTMAASPTLLTVKRGQAASTAITVATVGGAPLSPWSRCRRLATPAHRSDRDLDRQPGHRTRDRDPAARGLVEGPGGYLLRGGHGQLARPDAHGHPDTASEVAVATRC